MLYAPLPVIINLLLRIYAVTGPYVSPSNVQPEPTWLVNILKASVSTLAKTTPPLATPVNAVDTVVAGAVSVAKFKELSELVCANA